MQLCNTKYTQPFIISINSQSLNIIIIYNECERFLTTQLQYIDLFNLCYVIILYWINHSTYWDDILYGNIELIISTYKKSRICILFVVIFFVSCPHIQVQFTDSLKTNLVR